MTTIEENFQKIGLTYDDVLLKAQYSDVDPTNVNLETQLTKNIRLKIPILSAAMDTVTESKMAIALALEGGLGVIHRNMTPEEEAHEVELVKRFESGFVEKPLTLGPKNTLADAREINKKYSGIPITEDNSSNGKLLGLLTSKDYYFDDPGSDLIQDYMTPFEELIIAYDGITLEEANKKLKESKKGKVLIINDDNARKLMSIVCRKDLEKNYYFPNACKDKNKRLRVAAAVGPTDYKVRAEALVKAKVDALVIDTAHGHSKNVIDTIKAMKDSYKVDVIAGNVATKEGVKALIDAGADAIKVGIGPGAICTTRVVAGVGVPQATAVFECVEAGGEVQIGSLFAGTDEAPGETYITEDHRVFKSYRGMGSIGAMQKGSADRYGQQVVSGQLTKKLVPEGIEGMVPAIGPLKDHVYQMIGGLRQAMGYCGAKNLLEFRKRAEFIRATTAVTESHPRVPIIKRAPNYPTEDENYK